MKFLMTGDVLDVPLVIAREKVDAVARWVAPSHSAPGGETSWLSNAPRPGPDRVPPRRGGAGFI